MAHDQDIIRAMFAGSEGKLANLIQTVINDTMKPAPATIPSEWCEKNLILPQGVSSKPGLIEFYPYQRGIIDTLIEPGVKQVYVKKASRTGWSQIIAAACCYLAATKASPIVSIFPKDSSSASFERKYLRKMINASTVMRELIPNIDRQPWKSKEFINGASIDLKDAILPDNFSEYSARYMFGDEIDRSQWNPGSEKTSEGDKTSLMFRRMDSYDDGIMMLGSSPGLAGSSRIEDGYERGDKRKFHVPCPHCGEKQVLEWGGKREGYGVMWPEGKPLQAYYQCRHCPGKIQQSEQLEMVAKGEWIATAVGEPGVVSFDLPALISPLTAVSWGKLAVQFKRASVAAKDHQFDLLQAFTNTVLGQTWEARAGKKIVNAHELEGRQEKYPAEVPPGVKLVTMGFDTQNGEEGSGGYLVGDVWGWGQGEEGWLIGRYRFNRVHPFSDPLGKLEVEDFILNKRFKTVDGGMMKIHASCIDTGGGLYTNDVYEVAHRLAKHRVWAIKGRSMRNGARSPTLWPRDPTITRIGSQLHLIDTGIAKDKINHKLTSGDRTGAPLHFPFEGAEGSEPIDTEYFEGFTKEIPVLVPGGNGAVEWKMKKGQKGGNEPLDCCGYSYAATHGLRAIKGGRTIEAWLAPDAAKEAVAEWAAKKAAEIETAKNGETVSGADDTPKPAAPTAPVSQNPMERIRDRVAAREAEKPKKLLTPSLMPATSRKSSWMSS